MKKLTDKLNDLGLFFFTAEFSGPEEEPAHINGKEVKEEIIKMVNSYMSEAKKITMPNGNEVVLSGYPHLLIKKKGD
jgi:hypothetical protein